MLHEGWVVVATDYPGLGTSGPHAYLVGNAAGYAVLDAVRAAQGVPRVGAGSRFAVWGLSQGAHAALLTGQVAGRYAPDLQLAGVIAAAPSANQASSWMKDRFAGIPAKTTCRGH
ncbi:MULTISPECIES: lipase family protein [unclassified Rhizobium]|uniref:lipase family protein n=1 Tax=unclassified Rhizobium TaxID=2613769 RepID=UPI0016122195|nr:MULTISPECIES: lipase family protein [unclassified Rhizobium]MBB3287325.1 alpha-beta hydrolase superfamily lysophospholipase [Rhizobium sp. BK252]MBB3402065.1 alpha-beta hydrolase superfamily lysophospholipase [Rhizobium sp. BK289]MBB3414642.1 alpha-beta hydrolase superfamily lysophospholipase [Rhizobium sp. BK284]MBB3482531.1 alpha-beta hydrolase superfamily lysophospholipase [Rhizobium sp. BK347]MDK4721263.1 lipase family protein [Rhizobium sp. CNPSo 3968]